MSDADTYFELCLRALDRPWIIWSTAFEKHLTDVQRVLLLCLSTYESGSASIEPLREATEAACQYVGVRLPIGEYRQSLSVLEGTFLKIDRGHRPNDRLVSFWNPSVVDYLMSYLDQTPEAVQMLLLSATDPRQLLRIYRLGLNGPSELGRTGHRRRTWPPQPGSKTSFSGILSALTGRADRFRDRLAFTFEISSSALLSWQLVTALKAVVALPNELRPPTDFFIAQIENLVQALSTGNIDSTGAIEVMEGFETLEGISDSDLRPLRAAIESQFLIEVEDDVHLDADWFLCLWGYLYQHVDPDSSFIDIGHDMLVDRLSFHLEELRIDEDRIDDFSEIMFRYPISGLAESIAEAEHRIELKKLEQAEERYYEERRHDPRPKRERILDLFEALEVPGSSGLLEIDQMFSSPQWLSDEDAS